jgi:hypothetical protein
VAFFKTGIRNEKDFKKTVYKHTETKIQPIHQAEPTTNLPQKAVTTPARTNNTGGTYINMKDDSADADFERF